MFRAFDRGRGGLRVRFFLLEVRIGMKKIEAIIKPFKLDEVKEALQEAGFARKAIRNCIAALSMSWTFYPRSKSKSL